MLKRFLLTLLTITAVAQIFAAGFPKPKFVASFSKNTAKSGDIIEIIIRFDVVKGFHVYSEKVIAPKMKDLSAPASVSRQTLPIS